MVLFNSVGFYKTEDKTNPIKTGNIDVCFHQHFRDTIACLEREPDKERVIIGLKKLLSNKVNSPAFYETVLTSLVINLFNKGRYGEVLYYLMAVPYYTDNMLQAAGLACNETLKNASFRQVITTLNRNNRQKVNVLLYNTDFHNMQSISDAIKVTCQQNLYICTFHKDLLLRDKNFIDNYRLFVAVNNDTALSLEIFAKFKASFSDSILCALYCESQNQAAKVHALYGDKIDYIIYNDKMLYGLVYTALNSITPL